MKKFTVLACFFLIALAACQPSTQPAERNTVEANLAPAQSAAYTDLSVAGFKTKIDAGNAILLDVRTPAETAAGKIGGAVELDYRNENFAASLDSLDKDATYLVYCQAGGRSASACKLMAEKGFKNLFNLSGGYTAWTQENK